MNLRKISCKSREQIDAKLHLLFVALVLASVLVCSNIETMVTLLNNVQSKIATEVSAVTWTRDPKKPLATSFRKVGHLICCFFLFLLLNY